MSPAPAPLNPDELSALAHARQLHAQGRVPEAGAAYFRLLEAHPEDPAIHFSMGQLALMANKADHAEFHFRKALAAAPGMAECWGSMGVALDLQGRPTAALECFRRGVQLDPEDAGLRVKVAIALRHLSRLEEALAEVDQVIESQPNHPDALIQRGELLKELGQWSESDEAFRTAVLRNPGDPHARYQWACVQLSQGLFVEGWAGYESRLESRGNPAFSMADRAPIWDGRLRPGTSLLVRLEQGLGDTLQFIRYLPRLLAADMELIIQRPPSSQNPVLPLILGQDWPITIVGPGEDPGPVGHQVNLLSLPHLTGLGPESVTGPPYLKVPERHRQKWGGRLASIPGLKVGVVWQGNKAHPNDESRSINPLQFSRLIELDGISFISLQKDRGGTSFPDMRGRFADWMEEVEDLTDTAALVDGLDVVVSVDTSVAHLAGALGKPVYLLLPYSAEWRWLRTGDRTPWYPSHRLLRQSRPGDWEGVLAALENELRDRVASHHA